jgi:hypothetical protein
MALKPINRTKLEEEPDLGELTATIKTAPWSSCCTNLNFRVTGSGRRACTWPGGVAMCHYSMKHFYAILFGPFEAAKAARKLRESPVQFRIPKSGNRRIEASAYSASIQLRSMPNRMLVRGDVSVVWSGEHQLSVSR